MKSVNAAPPLFDADHSCPSCQANVEILPIQRVNEAYESLGKSNVKYRFSIDMASLKS